IPVALKFVFLGESRGDVELRALEMMKGLRHANLIAIFGAWQISGRLVIAMELADRTLLDRFRDSVANGLSGIPAAELLLYMQDAAKGIDYLNAQYTADGQQRISVQHRDIKPQNLLLVGGSVKVSDF